MSDHTENPNRQFDLFEQPTREQIAAEARTQMEAICSGRWIERVAKNLLPLSEEKKELALAMREWIYDGVMNDARGEEEDGGFSLENDDLPDCELCDHPYIRYQFQINNQNNNNSLWIGSSCITKFGDGIQVVDSTGVSLLGEAAQKKVEQDRNSMIKEAKRKNVIHTLNQMRPFSNDGFIDSLITYFNRREAFTPDQLLNILSTLRGNNIRFKPGHLKMTMRRNREKEQLKNMDDNGLRHLWRSLSSNQRNWVLEMRKEQGRPEKKAKK